MKNVSIQIAVMDSGHMVKLAMTVTIYLEMVAPIAKQTRVIHARMWLWSILCASNALIIAFSVI